MLPSGSIPLFFRQNIPLYHRCPAVILSAEYPPTPLRLRHRSQHLPACQHLPTYQLLPACESFNKPLLPAGNTHAGNTHNTRAGKVPNNIMIVIIIIISIR